MESNPCDGRAVSRRPFYRDGDDKQIVKVEVGVLYVVIFIDNCNNVMEYRSTQQLGKASWLAR
jgi:hypothetical protein